MSYQTQTSRVLYKLEEEISSCELDNRRSAQLPILYPSLLVSFPKHRMVTVMSPTWLVSGKNQNRACWKHISQHVNHCCNNCQHEARLSSILAHAE